MGRGVCVAGEVDAGGGEVDAMTYIKREHYSISELDRFALDDLIIDLENALKQAANGPYFPEKGITKESLRAYAEKCRKDIERYSGGGAHAGLVKRNPQATAEEDQE